VDPYDDEISNYIVDCYAGFAAQVYFAPDCEQDAIEQREDDDELARPWLSHLPGSPTEIEAVLREEAAQLVVAEWKAIEAMAEELLRFKTLDATEVEMLVDIVHGEEAREGLEHYRCMIGRHAGHECAAK
jgi:hypothetical protein